jgi:hypothetical protein
MGCPRTRKGGALAALCLIAVPAAAQQGADAAPPAHPQMRDAKQEKADHDAQVANAGNVIGRELASPDQDLRTGYALTGIVVTSDLGKTDASLALSGGTSRLDAAGRHLFFTTFTAKATAPIDKDSGEANFLTDAGLPGAASLELGFSLTRTPYVTLAVTPDDVINVLDGAVARCKAVNKAVGSDEDCTANSHTLEKWLSPDERSRLAAPIADHWTTSLALAGGIGRASYDWRDALTLTPTSGHHIVYHVTAELGGTRVSKRRFAGGWHLGIGGEYRHDYSEAKKRILCSPPPATGPQECFQSPFAAPGHDDKAMAFGIARRRFYVARLDLPLGLQVKGVHDFLHDQWAAEIALFGFADKDGKLQGGIKAKFQTHDNDPATKEKRAAVAIFVGSTF